MNPAITTPAATSVAAPADALPGRPTVLLVDDEPAVTAALAASLHKEPFDVLTASSAEVALQILARRPIDVVVSDERMPGTPGSTFLARVRREWPRTMRVLLSGYADVDATLRAINEAHVFRFLVKPCAAAEIAFCIQQALAAGARKRAAESAASGDGAAEQATGDRAQLRDAVGRMWMAYQPVVWATTHELYAHEALVRSDHPTLATPDRLLPLAEQLDEIPAVDDAIRDLVAADLERFDPRAHVLVNVHPRSLRDERLFDPQGPLCSRSDRIILELTERENLEHVPGFSERLARLRALGFRLAVDDLGAGYAGLTTFALVTPDLVKFDMELVRGIDQSPTKSKVVASIAALCRSMGILTIAEGIETTGEHDRVVEIGCDLLQGYLLGRPRRLAP